jgi:hypothetical protein
MSPEQVAAARVLIAAASVELVERDGRTWTVRQLRDAMPARASAADAAPVRPHLTRLV